MVSVRYPVFWRFFGDKKRTVKFRNLLKYLVPQLAAKVISVESTAQTTLSTFDSITIGLLFAFIFIQKEGYPPFQTNFFLDTGMFEIDLRLKKIGISSLVSFLKLIATGKCFSEGVFEIVHFVFFNFFYVSLSMSECQKFPLLENRFSDYLKIFEFASRFFFAMIVI